jgi:hypothetical protein
VKKNSGKWCLPRAPINRVYFFSKNTNAKELYFFILPNNYQQQKTHALTLQLLSHQYYNFLLQFARHVQ